jgi:signal transduction histidine kinase
VCWAGQLGGVGTDDPLGEAEVLLMCWIGGLAVNEVSRVVEQTRVNNELLAGQEAVTLRHAVVQERLRFARELHDAIGSSLTVIALQAGAARRLAPSAPDRARRVMRGVAAAAREGLAALDPDGTDADIAGLVDRIRATGLVVDADLADVERLGPDVGVLVHRILSEALTNVLRHAPGSRAILSVRIQKGQVEVEVTNTTGVGSGSTPGSGRGLAGIRERVAACAGEVSCAPRADGGFEVRARLPLLVADVAP